MTSESPSPPPCRACTERPALPFEFSMAFQPVVDVRNRSLFACEALVRGTDGSGAAAILAQVTDDNRYQFDQACRVKAVELAARLQLSCYVSINFLPNAVYEPATCIRATLEAAKRYNFPPERLLFEVTEGGHRSRSSQEHSRRIHPPGLQDRHRRLWCWVLGSEPAGRISARHHQAGYGAAAQH